MKFEHAPAVIPQNWKQNEREYAQQLDALFDQMDGALTKVTTTPTVVGDDGKSYEIHVDSSGGIYLKRR